MPDNAPRFQPQRDGVESWFLRANHPTEPRAIWVKATVLCSSRGAIAETWCSVFEGTRTRAVRRSVPLSEADFHDGVTVAGDRLGAHSCRGEQDELAWELSWQPIPGPLGEPLCLLPSRRLVDGPFPKNKLLTPAPAALFSGTLRWGDERWAIDEWVGMQGHNWGAAHAPEYAWGHCVFLDGGGEPFALVEGASGRIRLGPVLSPLVSLLAVRRGGRELRFDRILDTWRQEPRIDFPSWTLRMRGADGEARLTMRGDPERMVCLGYDNPDGTRSYCLNSKTAEVHLEVEPADDDAFECTSEHGGALEFLQPAQEPRVQPVV